MWAACEWLVVVGGGGNSRPLSQWQRVVSLFAGWVHDADGCGSGGGWLLCMGGAVYG